MEFILFLFFPLLIIVTVFRVTSSKNKSSRIRIVAIALGIPFLILFADEIAGKLYFNILCNSKAGVNYYKPVELPSKFWANDKLNIFNKNGYLKRDFWLNYIDQSKGNIEKKYFNIEKDTSKIIYKENNKLLAEIVTFRHWGGWLRQFSFGHNSANSCAFISNKDFSRNLYTKVFIKP